MTTITGLTAEATRELISEVGGVSQRPNRIAVFGPSTEAIAWATVDKDHPIILGQNIVPNVSNVGAAFNAHLGGRMDVVYNGGTSGATSESLRYGQTDPFPVKSMNTVIQEANARGHISYWYLGQLPGNDFATIPAAESIINVTAILERFSMEPGIKILATLLAIDAGQTGTYPRPAADGGGNYTAAQFTERTRAYNEFVRDWCRTHVDWVLVDVHGILSRHNEYIDGYSEDGLHQNNVGGERVGAAIADAIRHLTYPDDRLAVGVDKTVLDGRDYFMDNGSISNETQFLAATGATGGNYTITVHEFDGTALATTAPISWNSLINTVGDAINAVLPGTVTASGGAQIEFTGSAYVGRPLGLMTVNSSNLTGPSPNYHFERGSAGGTVPGWNLNNLSHVLPTAEPREDGLGNWQALEFLQSGATVTVLRNLPTFAEGSVVYMEFEFEVVEQLAGVEVFEAYIFAGVADSGTRLVVWTENFGISPSPKGGAYPPGRYVARTSVVQFDKAALSGYTIVALTSAAGKIRIGRAGIRKLN